jgi:hypothetical protein
MRLAAATLAVAIATAANATWKPEYAQIDPALQQWFKSQRNPSTNVPCCDTSDGAYAEEDIRDGHYWARFTAHNIGTGADVASGWMQVPDDAVIKNANRNGAPVVWYYFMTGSEGPILYIRCFVPGGGV